MTDLTHKIATFAVSLDYQDIPESTIQEVKRHFIDSIGCALGAFIATPCKIARTIAHTSNSSLGARVIGTTDISTPELAAFANGTMIRYLDYNDTYLSKEPAHPSDNFAALLAIADAFELSGEALIRGAVIAYEVQCRLCDAYSIRKRGWDHVTYGSFSTVAGCGAMLGFDEDMMVHALGLAGVPNNAMRQTRVGELSMWKGCAFANASRNGVFATMLAHLGMTGPIGVFEGEMGFFNEVCGGDKFDIPRFGGPHVDGQPEPFMIDRTYIKKYSAEYHSQSAVDAALELVESHGHVFGYDEIDSVEIGTFSASYEIIGAEPEKWQPQSRETADHSLPFITCAALIDGDVTLDTYQEWRYQDEKILNLLKRTKVVDDPRLKDLYPEKGIPNRVTVRLKNGEVMESQVAAPRGHALNPMSDDEINEKFFGLAEQLLTHEQIIGTLDTCWQLEQLSNLDALYSRMVV